MIDGVRFDGVVPPASGGSVEDLLHTTSVPAVSLAQLHADGTVSAQAWGVTSRAAPRPVRTSTQFQSGSISKTVAAVCALRLVADSRFGLDDDVNDLAGERLLTTVSDTWRPRVTVRQLLSHTAGTNVGGFPGYASTPAPDAVEIIRGSSRTNTPPVRVIGVPGTRFAYSGGGFVVLQEVIARAVRAPFAEVAADRVLVPAGMTRSTYVQGGADDDRASGHRVDGSVLPGAHHLYPEQAAAGLWSTPADLARLFTALVGSLRGDRDALLPEALAQEMCRDQSGASYGLGIELAQHGRPEWLGHSGDDEGFVADLAGTRAGDGVVLMTNGAQGRSVINAIRPAVTREWDAAPAGPREPEPGRYVAADGRVVVVDVRTGPVDGAVVTIAVDGGPPLPLRPSGAAWTSVEVNVTLLADPAGTVTVRQTMHTGDGRPLVASRAEP